MSRYIWSISSILLDILFDTQELMPEPSGDVHRTFPSSVSSPFRLLQSLQRWPSSCLPQEATRPEDHQRSAAAKTTRLHAGWPRRGTKHINTQYNQHIFLFPFTLLDIRSSSGLTRNLCCLLVHQIIDPFVEVEIIGLPIDCCKEQTRVVDDNGSSSTDWFGRRENTSRWIN